MQLELFRSQHVARLRAVRMAAQSVWKNPWFGWLLILGFAIWYAWWALPIPSPAKAATVLGVIAAIMALRGDPEGYEKMFWIIVLFAFLFMEIKAIDHKEREDESLRQAQRAEESRQFQQIGDGIQKTINQDEKQFEATAAGLNSAITSSTQAMINTRHHAVIATLSTVVGKPDASGGKLFSEVNQALDVSWTNVGQEAATDMVIVWNVLHRQAGRSCRSESDGK
jgi:hypothetical protein